MHGQWCKDQRFHSHWCCSAWLWDKHPVRWHRQLTPLEQDTGHRFVTTGLCQNKLFSAFFFINYWKLCSFLGYLQYFVKDSTTFVLTGPLVLFQSLKNIFKLSLFQPSFQIKSRPNRVNITCACAAYDAVVDDGATVDRDLQAVVCIVVLSRFIIRIELQQRQQ